MKNLMRVLGIILVLGFVLAGVIILISPVSNVASASTGTLHITENTTLTEDHFGNIDMAADGITLDCAGYSVIGSGVDFGIIIDWQNGVTVKDCHVLGFEYGIMIWVSSNNTLTGNTAEGNLWAGFSFYQSDINTLTENIATNNGADGFGILESYGNTFTENIATENVDDGFNINVSNNNSLTGNTANNNNRNGFGIYSSDNTELNENSATGNSDYGFLLGDSNFSTLQENTSEDNGLGGYGISGSTGILLMENTAKNNYEHGFAVDYNATENILTENIAENNGSGGFIGFGFGDLSSGGGTAGTANTYKENQCMYNTSGDSWPPGLCNSQP